MRNVYLLALIFALSLIVIYYFQSHYIHYMTLFSNAFPLFIAGAAVIVSGFALRNYWEKLESKFSRVWLGFSLGMVFWFISELIWAIYTLIFDIGVPYPSVADVYRLVGYGFLLFAIFTYIELLRPAVSSKMLATALIFVLPTSVSIVPSLLLSVSAKASAINLATLIVDLAYPLLDLALLAQAMLGLLVFTRTKLKGGMGSVWLFINAGIIANAFGDILFSYTNLQSEYYSGHPLELFFHLGYLFFLLSFYIHTKKL